MEDICVVCFDAMDMKPFEDERENTETCIKLECGHAYHTRCIIRCLSHMNQKCPNCNKDKTPKQELTREGLVKKLVAELRRDDDIKFLMTEYKEIREELNEANAQLKKDVKEYIEKRRIELNLVEKKNYFLNCLAKIQGKARVVAKAKGPEYVGALTATGRYRFWLSTFECNFFGRPQAHTNRRLKFPHIRLNLY
jgi:hypothetical protein